MGPPTICETNYWGKGVIVLPQCRFDANQNCQTSTNCDVLIWLSRRFALSEVACGHQAAKREAICNCRGEDRKGYRNDCPFDNRFLQYYKQLQKLNYNLLC